MNKTLIAIALLATPLANAATLLPPGAHDQVPAKLQAPPQAKALAATLDRKPVSVSHALDATATLDSTSKPFVAQSREFWTDVSESELRAGVRINTSAPGALIRLSPQGGASAALDPGGVLLRIDGHAANAAALGTVADAKALRSAGMAVTEGTVALRLAANSGSGEMEIAAPHAQGRYLVHVFEPASSLVLNLTADRDTVLAGSAIVFHAQLAGSASLRLASGLVSAPDGYSADLHFARNADGSFSATFTPDAAHSNGPQLWEAHAFTAAQSGKLSVLRDAKTAFAVSAPSARFGGNADVSHDASGLRVALGVAGAGAPGRYQVNAVLYGTGADGVLHPAALSQSAAWLGNGGTISLGFDANTVATLHAPFELRDLRLIDQATMSVIEHRERGLVID
jgi:hypothetical protein